MLSNLQKRISTIKDLSLNAVFPWQCACCGMLANEAICEQCLASFSPAKSKCHVCLKPSLIGKTHPSCQTPSSIEGVFAALDYRTNNLDKAIVDGKYYFLPSIFPQLAKVAWQEFTKNNLNNYFTNPLLVPIPLSQKRLRWRGFNQAGLLADEISKISGWEVARPLSKRHTKIPQKDLGRDERQKSVVGIFQIKTNKLPWWSFLLEAYPIPPPINLKNRDIILIDDVVTTGATIKEATKVLKKHGAARVWGFALASE